MNDQISRLETALANTTCLVGGVGSEQWDARTPCDKWTVRELVQHTVGVMSNFAAGAGATGELGDPAQFDLGDDPAATCRAVAEKCVANWTARGELDSAVHLGETELPGAVAFNINMLDGYVHGWDIAQATDQDAQLDPALCAQLLAFAREVVPEAPREGDNFHAVVPVGDDAGPADQLLAYLGRQP